MFEAGGPSWVDEALVEYDDELTRLPRTIRAVGVSTQPQHGSDKIEQFCRGVIRRKMTSVRTARRNFELSASMALVV